MGLLGILEFFGGFWVYLLEMFWFVGMFGQTEAGGLLGSVFWSFWVC